VFIGEWDVVKTENKDSTVLMKDDIVENMVVNKNPMFIGLFLFLHVG